MFKSTVRRSACDQCRAKRVRCLRAQNSMAPCARCSCTGTRCATSASGRPGRPAKQRLPISTPGTQRATTLRDVHHVEVYVPAMEVVPATSAVHSRLPRVPVAHQPQPDIWAQPDDISTFFSSLSPSMRQGPASCEDMLCLEDQPSSPSQLQGLFNADEGFNAMTYLNGDSNAALDLNMDSLLNHGEDSLPQTPIMPCLSGAGSLLRFREEIDHRIAKIDAYYSDSHEVLQRCKDEDPDQDVENPAALLLTCSKRFTDIIQSLTPATQSHTQTEDALSTEIVLLVLSSYLALIRLFDSLFHRMYTFLGQVPRESYESLKVKSVLRIGGISSFQDMSLKVYAIGILDAIQSQMLVLERCMGIPMEYCLSGEAAASPSPVAPEMFSAHRAHLFRTVMAQEDIKSRRGGKSYVESIRASIKELMACLDG